MDVTQEVVTGEVKFKLYKGNIIKAGESSPYSLYSESLASFTTGELYDHHDADGFITLFGLPLKVRALMQQRLAAKEKKLMAETGTAVETTVSRVKTSEIKKAAAKAVAKSKKKKAAKKQSEKAE